jgi:hypothetical protein
VLIRLTSSHRHYPFVGATPALQFRRLFDAPAYKRSIRQPYVVSRVSLKEEEPRHACRLL